MWDQVSEGTFPHMAQKVESGGINQFKHSWNGAAVTSKPNVSSSEPVALLKLSVHYF